MKIRNFSVSLAEVAAIITWGIVFGITLYWLPSASPEIAADGSKVISLFIAYLACFLLIVRENFLSDRSSIILSLYIAQLACAFMVMWYLPINFLSILTIIWVSMLPHFLSIGRSIAVMLIVVVAWFTVYGIHWESKNALFQGLLYGTFHFFAIITTHQTEMSERASAESQRLNKELQATQGLLSEASRQNERTRIARDLHDLLGHHLTALIINLQVAGHLSEGESKDKIEQCHSLAKLLLSDVREAVSRLRENRALDFRKMVELLIDTTPKLEILAQIDAELDLDDLKLAKALLSCIQEAITNSLRHSGATRFWITMKNGAEGVSLQMHDNGRVKGMPIKGNGLKGMSERIEELAGAIVLEHKDNALLIKIDVPKQAYADGKN